MRHRQIAEKSFDFARSHFTRMPLAMKEDEAPHPVDIRLLRANRIVAHAQGVTQTRQKSLAGGGSSRGCCDGGGSVTAPTTERTAGRAAAAASRDRRGATGPSPEGRLETTIAERHVRAAAAAESSSLTPSRSVPDSRAVRESSGSSRTPEAGHLSLTLGRGCLAMPENLGRPLHPRIALKSEPKWAPERGLPVFSAAGSRQIRRNPKRACRPSI